MSTRRRPAHLLRLGAVALAFGSLLTLGIGGSAGAQNDLIRPESPTRAVANVRDAAPGDTVQVALVARNVSGTELAVQTTLTGLSGPALLLNGPNGLHATIDSCSTAWVTVLTPGNPGPTYRCEGQQRTLAARTPVRSIAERPLAVPGILRSEEFISLRAIIELPATAGNDYEDLAAATVRLDIQADLISEPGDGAGFDDLFFDELAYTGFGLLLILVMVGTAAIVTGRRIQRAARDRAEVAA